MLHIHVKQMCLVDAATSGIISPWASTHFWVLRTLKWIIFLGSQLKIVGRSLSPIVRQFLKSDIDFADVLFFACFSIWYQRLELSSWFWWIHNAVCGYDVPPYFWAKNCNSAWKSHNKWNFFQYFIFVKNKSILSCTNRKKN